MAQTGDPVADVSAADFSDVDAAAAAPDAAVGDNGSASPKTETPAAAAAAAAAAASAASAGDAKPELLEAVGGERKWPGWPGNSVYRLVVPVLKVGSIIGRKGELIKKLCEDTRARVRILDGALGTTDRIVLVSGKEELDAAISPAMDAVLRIFKNINGISEPGAEEMAQTSTVPSICSIRLLVPAYQSMNLIGKQGTTIKPIQDSSGAMIRILTGDELPFYASEDERVVDIHGEPMKVLKALEAVVGHLRKFLVDHSVLPLFEKNLNTPATRDHPIDPWAEKNSLYLEHETQLDSHIQRSGPSIYGQDPALGGLRSSGFGHTPGALVTQITQTMQISLAFAEDIIGVGGGNITYIRGSSGAVITVMESRGASDELTVEIKGTPTQVQTASQLIQDCVNRRKETMVNSYGGLDTSFRSSYSDYPSSISSHSLGGYGGYGGYSSYRL